MCRFILVLLFCCFGMLTSQAQVFTLSGGEKDIPVRFFKWEGETWLATNHHLFSFKKKDWQLRWTSSDSIVTAVAVEGRIWVGEHKHLIALDFKRNGDPVIFKQKSDVMALAHGNGANSLLVGTSDNVFLYKDTLLEKTLLSKIWVNDLCVCGDYTWIGTSIGLSAIAPDGTIQQYAEEGVKGFEIPDNIVEHILCLAKRKVLTITMPVALAFFDLNQATLPSHPDHFDYLGERDNNVLDASDATGGSAVFATTLGGVLLVRLPGGPHDHDHAPKMNAVRIRPELKFPG
ncbi:MAG: hypothetical protein WCR52_15180, partial [Bacteroidota bacterium]